MYSKWQMAKQYLLFWWQASNGKGHGIHSPFVYDFVRNILNDNRAFYCYKTIELLRKQLKQDNALLTIEDFGAGSHINNFKQRSVSSIAASSLKPKKWSRLLFRMVNYYQPHMVLELGTSLGITAAYLACAKADAAIITMEGAAAVAVLATRNFEQLHLKNIQVVTGNFDDTLPQVVAGLTHIDFVFIDGNHRKEPTLSYFQQLLKNAGENSVFIFDDIYWSEDMKDAWNIIKSNAAVTLTIDLFFIGIVFFRKENKAKQHFKIHF